MSWNNTRLTLPKELEGVIVYHEGNDAYRIDYLVKSPESVYTWAFSGKPDQVTHWMDLPAPPEKEAIERPK